MAAERRLNQDDQSDQRFQHPRRLYAGSDSLGKLPCISVSGNICNDSFLPFSFGASCIHSSYHTGCRLCPRQAPTVAGTITNIHTPYLLNGVCKIRALERSQYIIEIVFCGSLVSIAVGYAADKHFVETVVRTEAVAGKEQLFFNGISKHCVRPVKVWQDHKFQRNTAEVKRLSVFCLKGIERSVGYLSKKADCRRRRDDFDIGIQLAELFNSAAVIRFGVIDYQVIDFCNADKLVYLFKPVVGKTSSKRHKRGRVVALNKI